MVEKTIRKKLDNPADLDNLRQLLLNQKDPNKLCITVCAGTGCIASGADLVVEAFKEEIKKREIGFAINFKKTGCHGFCEWGALVVIRPEKILYTKVAPEDIPEIIESISRGTIVERLLYIDLATNEKIVHEYDVPFYKQQTRIIFGANGDIDPANIEDYIASGGYSALSKVLFHMSPEQVISEITKSGLRGRGGGGFPTGKKWQSTRETEGNIKYVIVNADEGDPGCYQDRSLVEGNPQSILEGLIIGAFAIGAHHGFIYIRNEYPLAVKNADIAIEQARQMGLLGKNILGSGFDFDVNINRGGGAFICGESSALIASLEGKIGEPKAKYIHMSEKGLWDKPSLLNNVKTWANVPLIVNR
ncbi:MAG: NAD(P)H-dependent oxidoreductase subunit E, partial [Chloroflexi bacterium]|nr:NAD(P)H-dependent oxidoreductase subunit E [Chloroflexota bacterium]